MDHAGQIVVYRLPSIRTLQHALRILYSIPQPILCYRQTITMIAPELDHLYVGCIRNDPENHLFTISFPSELYGYITQIRNSRDCPMVSYWKHPVTDFIQEIQITPTTEMSFFRQPQTIRVYTQGHQDLTISFDVYLFKSSFFRSKL